MSALELPTQAKTFELEITIDATTHHASYNLVVARGDGDQLAIVERLGQVAADPGCSAT